MFIKDSNYYSRLISQLLFAIYHLVYKMSNMVSLTKIIDFLGFEHC